MNVTARMESGRTADTFDQVRHAIRDDAGLSTPGAGQDEYGAFSGLYGFELLRVEKSAEIHLLILP